MAGAKTVTQFEQRRLDWLTIEDDDGREWRYRRVGPLDTAEMAQVEGHYAHGHATHVALVRDADGHPFINQAGPGLPRTIVVEHVDDPSDPLLSILALSPKEEYERVA
jgi:hypothetical protein